jgi:glycosyltransferase involved in cell wall biosynthesis
MARLPWLFYPDYRASNPYQTLLGASLAPLFAVGPATIDDALLRQRADETVFHLHWEDAVYARAASRMDAETQIARFLEAMAGFQCGGGRCVWTVHNAAPHEDRFPNESAHFRRALAARVDLIHVHGTTAAATMEAGGASADAILVIPHPHFGGAYPDDISDAAARRFFGLDADEIVFTFVGAMRPYKGLDSLAQAFARLHPAYPNARLILAGHPGNTVELDRIVARLGAARRSTLILPRFIDECMIQYVMRTADYVVLPYRNILTSGAMTLALGFSRPVIVPMMPALLDVVTPGHDCIAFDPQDSRALDGALAKAIAVEPADRFRMGRNARLTVEATSFAQLGRALTRWARDASANVPRAAA